MGMFDHKKPKQAPDLRDVLEARVQEGAQKIVERSPTWDSTLGSNVDDIQNVKVTNTVSDNLTQQAGVALSAPTADAPLGTETAPVVRPLFRKKTLILTTAPLAANGVYTSPWFDTELTGDVLVVAATRSNVAGVNFQIAEVDDISGSPFLPSAIQSAIQSVSYTANTATRIPGIVRQRYWQVAFTNGATPQTNFQITVTMMNQIIPMAISGGQLSAGAISSASICTINDTQGGGVGLDALVNVTDLAGLSGAFPLRIVEHVFNGTTWDRVRNNWNTVTGDTGAKVATFNGATQTNFDAVGAYISVLLGAVSGTTPTLSVQLQFSPDGGTTWENLGPATATLTTSSQILTIGIGPTNFSQTPGATPANLTSGANVSQFLNAYLPRTWRLVYTIGGTTPSFTIASVNVNYIRG